MDINEPDEHSPEASLTRRVTDLSERLVAAERRATELEMRTLLLEQRLDKRFAAPAPLPADAIVGAFEQPGREIAVVTQAVLAVSGWALSRAGIERVETLVDGEPRGHVDYGHLRPDVAALHPDYPDGEYGGFAGGVPVDDLADGDHTLVVRVLAKDGKRAELRTRFETLVAGRAADQIVAQIERPTADGRTVAFNRLVITGWAVAPAGIARVEALVDGEWWADLTYGALRPDVALAHPSYAAADFSGFAGSLAVTDLADGRHELTIRITHANGHQRDVTATFSLESHGIIASEVPLLNAQYATWRQRQAPTTEETERIRAEAMALAAEGPTFSLLISPDPAIETRLDDLVKDLRQQIYPRWQLCFAVDALTSHAQHDRFRRLTEAEPRVTVAHLPGRANRASAANGALAVASGEFVAVLEPHDQLSPFALFEIARALRATPEADLAYVDEDKVDAESGARWDPFFKPDWSPDLALSTPYLGRFVVSQRALVEEVGGFRPGFEDEEGYDLILRLTERARGIVHVPGIQISRRADPAAAVGAAAAIGTAARSLAVAEALSRRGERAGVEQGLVPGTLRVRYHLPEERPAVTVVLPTGGKLQYLRPCLDDLLRRTSYPNLRVLVIDNSAGGEVAALGAEYAAAGLRLRHEAFPRKPFNFSAMINHGVSLVETPYLVLLNDDITVVTPDWVEALLEHAQRPDVGAVGAKLVFGEGTLQHAGVVFGPYGGVGHAFRQYPGDESAGYFGLPNATREYSAVTFACAMLRRELFEELGPLDEEWFAIAFNDTDYCLRLRAAGYRNVYTPHAVLVHHESVTKTVIARPEELAELKRRWAGVIAEDPYYNPHLTRHGEDYSLDVVEIER